MDRKRGPVADRKYLSPAFPVVASFCQLYVDLKADRKLGPEVVHQLNRVDDEDHVTNRNYYRMYLNEAGN